MTRCLACGGSTKTRREKHYRYGVDFAKRTGTKPETVSRWENGKAVMGPQADRLLRILVARETPVTEYSVDVLAQIAADEGPTAPVRVELRKGRKGWKYRSGPALVAAT